MTRQDEDPRVPITREDKRRLRADVTDHLKTVPGTERLVATQEQDPTPSRRRQLNQRPAHQFQRRANVSQVAPDTYAGSRS